MDHGMCLNIVLECQEAWHEPQHGRRATTDHSTSHSMVVGLPMGHAMSHSMVAGLLGASAWSWGYQTPLHEPQHGRRATKNHCMSLMIRMVVGIPRTMT